MPALQPMTQDEQYEMNNAVGKAALECWALVVDRPKQEPWLSFLRENYRILRQYAKRSSLAAETCEAILDFMREYKKSEICKHEPGWKAAGIETCKWSPWG